MPQRPTTRRGRAALLVVLVLALLVFGTLTRVDSSRSAAPARVSHVMPGGMNMSDDDMRAMITRHFLAHPAHGVSVAAAPVDSFIAVNFRFDEDGHSSTQVDTAHITAGDAIRFKWGTGFHTATSGEGSSDPNSGVLFDHQMTSASDNFDFQFNSPGTFPFYCTVHEANNMRGVVVVSAPVGIATEPPPRIGFIARLTPNPTSGGVTSAINLPRAGRARLEVFDAQGRRIATPLDADLPMGIHGVAWNGMKSDGTPARAGIYLMRLSVPGRRETRTITIAR